MNNINLWNFKAKLYHYFRNKFPFNYFLRQENSSLLSLLRHVPPGGKVFDLGTGEGNALQLISNTSVMIGVDYSFSMLINAQHNVPAIFICSDLLKLPLKNDVADLVLIIGVLEYFSEPETLLQELQRITKPGAFAIISFSPPNILTFLRQFLGNRIYSSNLRKIGNLINKYGFQHIADHKLTMQHQVLIKKR